MAMPMVSIREPPAPCTALRKMKKGMVGARGQRIVETMNIHVPRTRMRFRPQISPIFPAGIRKTAEESRYEVATQLSHTALALYAC